MQKNLIYIYISCYRFKMATLVHIGNMNESSAVNISSRSIWNEKTDDYVTAKIHNRCFSCYLHPLQGVTTPCYSVLCSSTKINYTEHFKFYSRNSTFIIHIDFNYNKIICRNVINY